MATGSRIQAVERATGRRWDAWLAFFERIGGAELSHQELAAALERELHGVVDNVGWWAQSTAIAYEQLLGRRIPGQAHDGTFQANLSRSTSLDMRSLMDAWTAFAAEDDGLAALADVDVNPGGTDKRLTWRTKSPDGGGVVVTAEPKKDGTASLQVQLLRLASPEAAAETKRHWVEVVERFLAGL